MALVTTLWAVLLVGFFVSGFLEQKIPNQSLTDNSEDVPTSVKDRQKGTTDILHVTATRDTFEKMGEKTQTVDSSSPVKRTQTLTVTAKPDSSLMNVSPSSEPERAPSYSIHGVKRHLKTVSDYNLTSGQLINVADKHLREESVDRYCVNMATNDSEHAARMAGLLSPLELTDTSGHIEWFGNGQRLACAWSIKIRSPEKVGIVLHFTHVQLRRGLRTDEDDTVILYQGEQPLHRQEMNRVNGSLPVPPVIVRSNYALVWLFAGRGNISVHRPGKPHSRFFLNYIVYAHDRLPTMVGSRYNCSPPYVVPDAFQCDMVEQCTEGQDENDYNCSYKKTECKDWIPEGNLCVKFFFPQRVFSKPEANSKCEEMGAVMLELSNPGLKQLAAKVTSLSGYKELLVNLVKFEKEEGQVHLYRFLWKWPNYVSLELSGPSLQFQHRDEKCATLRVVPTVHYKSIACWNTFDTGYACMKMYNYTRKEDKQYLQALPYTSDSVSKIKLQTCSDQSLVQVFYSCPYNLKPVDKETGEKRLIRLLQCNNKKEVHYTVACDGIDDCGDKSDERFCYFQHRLTWKERKNLFICFDKNVPVSLKSKCNGQPDCFDNSDEKICTNCSSGLQLHPILGCLPKHYKKSDLDRFISPSSVQTEDFVNEFERKAVLEQTEGINTSLKIIQMDGYGNVIKNISDATQCPEGYILCPKNMCLPSYLVGNYLCDCLYCFDEHNYIIGEKSCSGFYRCLGSLICIHPAHVCDEVIHCPKKDDERSCDWSCPPDCVCVGLEYTCQRMFDPYKYSIPRYVDLSGVFQPFRNYTQDFFSSVFFLNLSSCSLTEFCYLHMSFLRVLDLSHNELITLQNSSLLRHSNLHHLNLSSNPLFRSLTENSFNISGTPYSLPLLSLTVSNVNIKRIDPGAFSILSKLKYLDLRGNPVKELFENSFRGLDNLQTLLADEHRLCCLYGSQFSQSIRCVAPKDELSSCSDLLGSHILRVTLWILAIMAALGNIGVLIVRVFFTGHTASPAFLVLVTNLCMADFLMSVYLIFIGVADAQYRGEYMWKQDAWTESSLCQVAGVLALVSSEVSVFIVCLITIDRFIVLRFLFSPHLHPTSRSASVACGVAWVVGLVMAVVPLLPVNAHWEFYSQNGICLPLPVTHHQFPGQSYSFSIFIVFNFILFMLIGAGQLAIFLTIHTTRKVNKIHTQRRRQQAGIARHLFFIVFTDFCCWFPVGVMGLLARHGTPIPGQVIVWTAVLVLPINSALNPFLYTLNTLLERRQACMEEKRVQRILNHLHVDISQWPIERVLQFSQCYEMAIKRQDQQTREGSSKHSDAPQEETLTETAINNNTD